MAPTGAKHEQPLRKNAFVHKLYGMLSNPDLSHLIWWSGTPVGLTFSWHPSKEFANALSGYFKHGNVASFVRQLHMYGFHKVSDPLVITSDRSLPHWEFRHSLGKFRKDDEESLVFIKRRLQASSQRSTVPDEATPTETTARSPEYRSHHSLYETRPQETRLVYMLALERAPYSPVFGHPQGPPMMIPVMHHYTQMHPPTSSPSYPHNPQSHLVVAPTQHHFRPAPQFQAQQAQTLPPPVISQAPHLQHPQHYISLATSHIQPQAQHVPAQMYSPLHSQPVLGGPQPQHYTSAYPQVYHSTTLVLYPPHATHYALPHHSSQAYPRESPKVSVSTEPQRAPSQDSRNNSDLSASDPRRPYLPENEVSSAQSSKGGREVYNNEQKPTSLSGWSAPTSLPLLSASTLLASRIRPSLVEFHRRSPSPHSSVPLDPNQPSYNGLTLLSVFLNKSGVSGSDRNLSLGSILHLICDNPSGGFKDRYSPLPLPKVRSPKNSVSTIFEEPSSKRLSETAELEPRAPRLDFLLDRSDSILKRAKLDRTCHSMSHDEDVTKSKMLFNVT